MVKRSRVATSVGEELIDRERAASIECINVSPQSRPATIPRARPDQSKSDCAPFSTAHGARDRPEGINFPDPENQSSFHDRMISQARPMTRDEIDSAVKPWLCSKLNVEVRQEVAVA